MCSRKYGTCAWRPIRDLVGLTESNQDPAPPLTHLQRIVSCKPAGRVDRRRGIGHVNRRGRSDSETPSRWIELHNSGLRFMRGLFWCAFHPLEPVSKQPKTDIGSRF